jgi:hypothetical protein
MTIVGGFDVHRKQITFDYVDTDTGLVRCGEIRPATRQTLRRWLGERCPQGEAEIAVEGCTGWRYVVEESRRCCPGDAGHRVPGGGRLNALCACPAHESPDARGQLPQVRQQMT